MIEPVRMRPAVYIIETEIDDSVVVKINGNGVIRRDVRIGWSVNDLCFSWLPKYQHSYSGCTRREGVLIELLLN